MMKAILFGSGVLFAALGFSANGMTQFPDQQAGTFETRPAIVPALPGPEPPALTIVGRGPNRPSSMDFAATIRKADTDETRKKAISDVRKALEKEYDGYIDSTKKQIEQLQERIKKLEEHLEKRKDAKERLVELKLEMIVSEADGLGWPGRWDRTPRPASSLGVRGRTVSGFRSVERAGLDRLPEPEQNGRPTFRGQRGR